MMKRLFRLLALLCAGLAPLCHAQNMQPGAGGFFSFGKVAGTGQLGFYLDYRGLDPHGNINPPPSTYTFDWNYTGTAPSACTFQAEGSSDAVHWFALTAATSCLSANMMHVAFKPVVYLRVNVLTYTQGDSTTAVVINYTRGGM